MKAIKALVAFMTLLLVAGLGLLAYGLYSKGTDLAKGNSRSAAASAGAQTVFGAQTVILPHDGTVSQWLPVGNVMVMVVATGNGPQLVVLDPAAGQELGRFVFQPDAPR